MSRLIIFLFALMFPLNSIFAKADKIIILKSERKLQLLKNNEVYKTYTISLGFSPEGHKTMEGDGKTPEGNYFIDGRHKSDKFHRALHISYPNENDIEQAKKRGVFPGGDIMIHGLRRGMSWFGGLHRLLDWTNGCIAVTNSEIEEIWNEIPNNTPIIIKP